MTTARADLGHRSLRSGPSRSGRAPSSPSLRALRERPRICGSPGSNRDSHRQRRAVDHDNRSGPVGDRRRPQGHGTHRQSIAGCKRVARRRARGRGVDARAGIGARGRATGARDIAQALRSGTSGLARGGARPALADRRRAAVRRRRPFPSLGAPLPRGCRRDRRPRPGSTATRDRRLLLTVEPAGASRHALSFPSRSG